MKLVPGAVVRKILKMEKFLPLRSGAFFTSLFVETSFQPFSVRFIKLMFRKFMSKIFYYITKTANFLQTNDGGPFLLFVDIENENLRKFVTIATGL